eukprot:gene7341-462_t
MAAHAQSAAPIKNYHLELLTLLAQDAAAARGGARVADGSMQLVLDVLQSIADDKMPTASAAVTQDDLSEDQFKGLVSRLKVTLVYGHPGPESRKRPVSIEHLASVHGLSVWMEDLTLVVPHIPGISSGHHYAPCIGAEGGAHCHLLDCCFGPDKERGASAGVVVDGSSDLVAERCLFKRCRESAVEVRSAGSRADLKGCKFIKCQKQAVMLYSGGMELKMEDCLIDHCGNMTMHHLLLVACGTAQLHKCYFLNNRSDAVVVQCDNRLSAPVLEMTECILKGNMSGVMFGCGIDLENGGGSGSLVNNQITDNANFGVNILDVAPNRQVHLIGNDFCGNGPNIVQRTMDVFMLKNVQDQVVVENNRGSIHTLPFSA